MKQERNYEKEIWDLLLNVVLETYNLNLIIRLSITVAYNQ